MPKSPATPTGRRSFLLASTVGALLACVVTCLFSGSTQSPKTHSLSQRLRGTAIDSSGPTNPGSNPKAAEVRTAGGYLQVGFDRLAGFQAGVTFELVNSNTPGFYYAPRLTNQIPSDIKALEGKEVALKGFMLPLKGHDGRIQEFILLKNQSMCCFGKPPNVNEWVHVRMSGKGVVALMDRVVTIYGKLHVGEYQENRQMLGLYQLDGDGIAPPAEF